MTIANLKPAFSLVNHWTLWSTVHLKWTLATSVVQAKHIEIKEMNLDESYEKITQSVFSKLVAKIVLSDTFHKKQNSLVRFVKSVTLSAYSGLCFPCSSTLSGSPIGSLFSALLSLAVYIRSVGSISLCAAVLFLFLPCAGVLLCGFSFFLVLLFTRVSFGLHY